jgi:UDP-N-acetylmuramoylalanine--D-glutamate ligase
MEIDLLHKKYRILVVGLGLRSGLSAANFLSAEEHIVEVSDSKSRDELSEIISKLDSDVVVHAGNQHPLLLDRGFDLVVLSPGVPAKIDLVQESIRRGIPVISEIELAFRYIKGLTIGITGTDGKSTTTAMTNHVLKELGWDTRMGGNIGIPLISLAGETTDRSVTVIELSSYQLETIDSFRPDAAAFLNLTPDHLDRYNSLDDYFAAKMRIAKNQTKNDFFIYNADDERVSLGASALAATLYSFSLTKKADAWYEVGSVFITVGKRSVKVFDAREMTVMGLHNVQNAMAVLLLIRSLYEKLGEEFPVARAAAACCSFKGLAHRMEKLGIYNDRLFINDSKATTVGAVEMALRSLDRQAVLILGGRAKGDDYSRLADAMKGKIRALVLIGETTDQFAELFLSFSHEAASDMSDAVLKAMNLSRPGDAILLSPATASFDMYKSFEHRGDVFREAFLALTEKR